MKRVPLAVLLVEDSEMDAELLLRELERGGYLVESMRVETAPDMRAALASRPWDIVISDYSMPQFDALGALEVLRESALDLPIIIVSGTIGEETAVAALHAGAHDFLLKGKLARLMPAIERELRDREARDNQQRVEQALRESEARFRRLAESGVVGITVAHRDGPITEANDAFLEMVGYSRHDLVAGNLRWSALTPPEWAAESASTASRLADRGVSPPHEKECLRKDGTRVAALFGAATLRGDQSIAITIDLTERKRVEEALLQSEQRYRRIIETTNEGVWMLDAALNTVFVNHRLPDMLGCTAADLVGRSFSELVPLEARAGLERDLERCRTGALGHTETTLRYRKNPEVHVLLDSAPIFDASGMYEGTLAMVMDISKSKRLEEQLRQTQKLEAVGRLAGGVAHDFNNILSVILSYTSMVLGELAANDPHREDLEEVRKASERATLLTRQLLAFSRQQVLQPSLLDLNRVLSDMEGLLCRLVGEDVEVSLLTPRHVGAVFVDSGQIEQVVMNLVVNARDAMPDGGLLTLETAEVYLDSTYAETHADVIPGTYVMLAVTDSGVGMSADVRARIFEPFFTTKEKGRGTGLGLSTVFGIVQQSSGHIGVYSEPGKGTTFKVYFPQAEGSEDLSPRSERSPTSLQGTETILLVEDEAQVRAAMRISLKRQGYDVLEAQNAGEALLIGEKHASRIHLLLTDVIMPRMSGPELGARLLALRPNLKILYVSGYTENAIVRHGVLDAGASFLQKPITPDALARKVREVLDP